MRSIPLLVALAAALAASASPARAETRTCTPITSLPAVIAKQGIYCLAADLTVDMQAGDAIAVDVNNVTIDCNDHRIHNTRGVGNQAVGIDTDGADNLVVRNCLVSGFGVGLWLVGDGHLVEDNRLEGNLTCGILVAGPDYVVRRNRIRDTGGGTGYFAADGIKALGRGEISDNIVGDVHATSTGAIGIDAQYIDGGRIAGNVVRGVVAAGAYSPIGIRVYDADRVAVRDNTVSGASGTGIACTLATVVALTGNHVFGFTESLSVCTASGDRNVLL